MDNKENQGGFERKMYKGNWSCKDCGKPITELPFEPDPARLDQLRCRDCYRPKKSFGGGGGNFR